METYPSCDHVDAEGAGADARRARHLAGAARHFLHKRQHLLPAPGAAALLRVHAHADGERILAGRRRDGPRLPLHGGQAWSCSCAGCGLSSRDGGGLEECRKRGGCREQHEEEAASASWGHMAAQSPSGVLVFLILGQKFVLCSRALRCRVAESSCHPV